MSLVLVFQLAFFLFDASLGLYKTHSRDCSRSFADPDLYWDRHTSSPGRCEVLLGTSNEECCICNKGLLYEAGGNVCFMIALYWKYDFKNPRNNKKDQDCVVRNHCIQTSDMPIAERVKETYQNYICGTVHYSGERVQRGECKTAYGTYICECYVGFQGRDCNDIGPEDSYATGVQAIFETKVKVFHDMTIMIAVKEEGHSFKARVFIQQFQSEITLTEPTIIDPSSTKLINYCKLKTDLGKQCDTYLQGSTSMYSVNVRFPLLRDLRKVWFYDNSNDMENAFYYPVGYMASLTITTTNVINGEEKISFFRTSYDHTYNVFVQYPVDIGCYKNTVITNCLELKKKVNIYDASNEIVAKGDTPFISFYGNNKLICSDSGDKTVRWTIFKVKPDGTLDSIEESKSESKRAFVIKPYSFTKGEYIVQFAVRMVNSMDIAENFDQCFITVVEAPILATIYGGTSRYVDVDTVIVLDGRESHDPNVQGESSKVGLHFHWTCTENKTGNPCLESYMYSPSSLGTNNYIKIPLYVLKPKKLYDIELTVYKTGKNPSKTKQTLLTGRMGIAQSIGVTCINCMEDNKANPTDYIQLLVKTVLKSNVTIETVLNYTWTFSTHPVYPPDTSVENIRVNETSQDLLVIGKNKLEENKTYYFRATFTKDSLIFAEIGIHIPFFNKIICYLTPESGIVAITNFTLNCTELSGVLYYEVYDKSSNDLRYYSGRMLFTGFDPIDNYFKMANKRIVVYGYNKFKMIKKWEQEVTLTPFYGNIKDIDDMVLKLEYIKSYPQRLLHSISVIPSAVKPDMDWPSISLLKRLVTYVKEVEIEAMEDIKLVLSSLEFILAEMSNSITTTIPFKAEEAKICADIILSVAYKLFERVKEFDGQVTLTETILQEMIASHLNVIEIILTVKNVEVLTKPIHLVNTNVLNLVKETTYDLVSTLYTLSSCLLWRQIQGDYPTKISSAKYILTEWAIVDKPKFLHRLRRLHSNTLFEFSAGFYRTVKNIGVLGIQVTELKVNPFWWAGGDINTNILLVDICFKVNLTQCKKRRTFYKAPIYLYFNIAQTYNSIPPIEINTVYLNFTRNPNDLDLDMTVYRFDPPLRAELSVQFQIENSKDYKVLFTVNSRPDFEEVNKKGVTVNSQSSVRYFKYFKDDIDKMYYMGIFPVHDGIPGTSAKLKLKIVHKVCKTWLTWKWGSQRCWVGVQETDEKTLRCDCSHLSMFAGTLQVPPYTLNPAMQFLLFLTEEFNWLPIVVLIIILVIFIILFIWGRCKDSRDLKMGIVTILGDNYPGEPFAYLIGVYTGSRINSSTDANVGIKLFGENDTSRAHILTSSVRPVLRGNSDDWFLLYSPVNLGTLESLHIWHDNKGKNPDWFIEKIEVYDLTDKVEYIFELNIWLALGVNEFPDAVIATSSIEDFYSVRRVFISNVVTGFRDINYWTSIFWKHARNPVKRVHRICVVLCFIMTAMICTVLIFYFYKGGEYEEDEPSYYVNSTDFIIFVISLLAASFMASLIMFIFRKSFSHKYKRMQSSLFIRPSMMSKRNTFHQSLKENEQTAQIDVSKNLAKLSTMSLYDSTQPRFMELNHSNQDERFIRFGLRSKLATERTMYERLAAAVHAIVRGSPLEPVRLPKYTRNVIVHKAYFITAWILFALTILSAIVNVLFFGHRIPVVEGKKWVTVFLCVLLFDALILSSLKILLCSLILACVFQRLVPASSYQLKAEDGMERHLVGDKKNLLRIAQRRSDPMYCPLNEKLKEHYRQKSVRREQYKTLIDFLVVLLLILVLVMLTSLFTANMYSSNEHAVWMLTKGPSSNVQNFSNIYNQSQYSEFIFHNLKDQIHRFIWYNENPLNDNNQMRRKSWTYDCTMRLLGNARIRQLRVIMGECPEFSYFKEMEEYCSPPWSSGAEDTGTYGSRWEIGGIEDVSRKSNAWRYTDAARSNSSASYGSTLTVYPSGGFIEDLGFTKNVLEHALSSLFPQHWLDHVTRAVFVEFTLFNVNTRLFTQIVLVAEQMPTGEYLVALKAQSVSKDVNFDFWMFSYIVFLISFLVRMCILINRRGVFVYFSQTINVFEGFLLTLGFLTLVFYVIHLTASSEYVREFQKSGIDEFFNFSNLISYLFATKTMLVVLFACVVIRILTSMRFGRIYFTFYYTFLLSLPWIVRLVLCFILYLAVIRRLAGFLLNIFVFPKYTTVIIYHKEVSIKDCNDLSYKVLLYILCLSSYVVVLLFIASFTYYLKVAKVYKLIDTDNLNLYVVFKDIVKSIFHKVK